LRTIADLLGDTACDVTGDLDGTVERVSIDTRTECRNALFVALTGENADGHVYCAEAVEKGAAALLVSRRHRDEIAAIGDAPAVFAVEDTLAALQSLAASYREQVDPRVIAVTGSTGKTGTKDFIASILSKRFKIHSTPGNLNNHIGLPLTLLGMDGAEEVLVAEMGANHRGEIEMLARIARPEIGVVTNIGPGHLEFFGSLEGVAAAKAELVESLPESGTAVLPADDEFFSFLSGKTGASILSFGFGEGADWRIVDLERSDADGYRFTLRDIEIVLRRFGRHHILNASAAAAACSVLGATPGDISDGIAETRVPPDRGAVYDIGGVIVVDDSYNSNPESLRVAVEAFMEMNVEGARWLVLGDMFELGERSMELHAESGRMCGKAGVDGLLTIGEYTVELNRAASEQRRAPGKISHFIDSETLAAYLDEHLAEGDAVLVKGSRGMKMERVIEAVERLRKAGKRRVD
jgi:UDP-N-acetylmuramoyl-tripeptide--D-alanyl-D-alanine ligase